MNRHVLTLFVLFGFFAFSAEPEPVTPELFSRTAPILTPEKSGVYSLDLGEEVYEGVVYSDLRDLRVFNNRNQMVPFGFSLKTGEEVHQTEQRELKFFPIMGERDTHYGTESRLEWREDGRSGSATVKFPSKGSTALEKRGYLIDVRKMAHPLRSIELDWSGAGENSFVNIEVESSNDLKSWGSVVTTQSLAQFKFEGQFLAQKNIDLPDVETKYLRITWDGNKVFNLKKVMGEFSMSSWSDTKRHFTKISSNKKDGLEFFYETIPVVTDRIRVFLPDRNTVVKMEISSRDNEKESWRSRFEGAVYRVDREGGEFLSPAIKSYPAADRYWRVRVYGKDAVIGEKGPELELGWISHRLFFLAHGEEPFKLAWGLEGAQQPDFGLESMVRQLTDGGDSVKPVVAQLGNTVVQKTFKKTSEAPLGTSIPWKQYLLWGGLVLLLVVTSAMAYKLFQEMN